MSPSIPNQLSNKMPSINLLPWRAEERQLKQSQFIKLLVITAVIAVGIIFFASTQVAAVIDNQKNRNQFLERELTDLDNKIATIKELEKKKTQLEERMKTIESLQGSRPQIVRLFEEIVRILPEGIYLTKLSREGDRIFMEGSADSNTRVSKMMRSIEHSKWLKLPVLSKIQSDAAGLKINQFILNASISAPSQTEQQPSEFQEANQ